MIDNYAKIVQDNLSRLYDNLPKDLGRNLPGEQDGDRFVFDAFGEKCLIEPKGIMLGNKEHICQLQSARQQRQSIKIIPKTKKANEDYSFQSIY
jgi:hypothetical protein